MNVLRRISFLMPTLFLASCASTPRETIMRNIIVGVAAGYVVGNLRKENSKAYGLLYGGIAGTAAGLATAYLASSDSENERLLAENKKLKTDLEKVYSPELVHAGTGMMNAKVPEKYKAMINPGEWKIYAYDQWIEDGENRLIHQDKIMELTPPSLVPVIVPNVNKGN